MRVLFLTAYMNATNLKSSSTVFGYGEIARSLVAKGHTVYWYVPRNVIANRDFPDEFLDNPCIKLLETDVVFDQYYEDCNIPDDLVPMFHQCHGKYPIDAIITSKLNLVGTLRLLLNHLQDKKCPEIKIYGIEIFPKFRDITPIVPPFFEEARALGWKSCSRVYWGNPEDMNMGISIVRKLYSSADALRLRDKSYPFGTNGVPIARIESATNCTRNSVDKDTRVNRVQFLGRPWGETDEFEDAITVYEAGLPCDFLLSLPGGCRLSKSIKLNRFGDKLDIREGVSRAEFYGFLKTSKVGVNIQKAGNFPTMHMEALYAGVVLVMPPIYWWSSFWADYPFTYKGKAELMSMVKFVLGDYPRALSMVQKYREMIHDKYDSVVFADRLVQDVTNDFSPAVRCSDGMREIFDTLPASFSFEEVCQKFKKETRISMEIGENPRVVYRSLAYLHPKAWIRGMLLGLGFKESSHTDEVTYVR